MAIEIIQTPETRQENLYKPDPDVIEITISTRDSGAFLKVYFGANIKREKQYVLGYESAKPVLVPVEQGGYSVSNRAMNGSGTMRFKLTDGALDIFGAETARKIRENIDWHTELVRRIHAGENTEDMGNNPPNDEPELIGRIDDELRVWIEKE